VLVKEDILFSLERMRKRTRAESSIASSADDSETEDPEFTVRRRTASDHYNVCEAIEHYAKMRSGCMEDHRREDLQDEIVLKTRQIASLADVLSSSLPLTGAQRSHYKRVHQALSDEVDAKQMELASLEGEDLHKLEPVAYLLSARDQPCSPSSPSDTPCAGRQHRFATLRFAERYGRVIKLEERVEQALLNFDADFACKLVRKAAAWLDRPHLRQRRDHANVVLHSYAMSDEDLQRDLRRNLIRLLDMLDLCDEGTRDLIRNSCVHLMALVNEFEIEQHCISLASGVRQWQKLQGFAQDALV